MANIRSTVTGTTGKYISRTPGSRVGLQVNSFGAQKLKGITGKDLAPIIFKAMGIAYNEAYDEWPVRTGASRDSIDLTVQEVGPKSARVALQAGGPKLIRDKRNESGKDYAPFIEFNGTATVSPGTLTRAVIGNQDEIKAAIREGVAELIRRRLGG